MKYFSDICILFVLGILTLAACELVYQRITNSIKIKNETKYN